VRLAKRINKKQKLQMPTTKTFLFFSNYTIHRRHSQRTHTHPYEYTHANHTPRSIFEDCAGKSSRLTKSPQASRCRRERRLPLKAQTPLNPENSLPQRVEPRTWGATGALVTIRPQFLVERSHQVVHGNHKPLSKSQKSYGSARHRGCLSGRPTESLGLPAQPFGRL
jgi:hypothetical protein